jgi:hypothetical protein
MIYIIFLLIIGLPLLLLIISTIKKGKFGINLSLPNCPKCDEKVPAFRSPTSTKQALWGGWTCLNCGCEIDKWGNEISKVSESKQLEQSKIEPINTLDENGKTPIERVFDEK